jgi:hypothetical protein
MVGADDVNTLGDNISTVKKKKTDARKEVGLAVSVGKTKYVLLSLHQNAGQNHGIKIANNMHFENISQVSIWE